MSLINYPKSLGLITEYNPLHNGHIYHIRESKQKTGAETVIAVMSGHFTQRGEPAIADPWQRAKWALESGVDLVIELPVLFSTSSAAYFAHGAIFLLDALCVDTLCFGSESGDINALASTVSLLKQTLPSLSEHVRNQPGKSYSQHRSAILSEQNPSLNLNRSNDILGIAYLESLHRIESKIEPFTIKRIQNDYHSEVIESAIASATAIRKATREGQYDAIMLATPSAVSAYLTDGALIRPNIDLWQEWIMMLLRHAGLEQLENVHDMASGLPQRLVQGSRLESYAAFENAIQTKIFTSGRLKRCLCKMVLGIEKKDLLNDCQTNPQYIRILGFNEKGRKFLNQTEAKLPIITNAKHYRPENPEAMRQWALDQKAADLYALLLTGDSRRAGRELRTPPFYARD